MNTLLKLTKSEAPLDIYMGGHASSAEIEDPDEAFTVPNSPSVAILSDEKWTTVRRKRSER